MAGEQVGSNNDSRLLPGLRASSNDVILPSTYIGEERTPGFKVGELQAWLGGLSVDDTVYIIHANPKQAEEKTRPIMSLLDNRLVIDWNLGFIWVDQGKHIKLPLREAALLQKLIENLNTCVPNSVLTKELWGHDDRPATVGLRVLITRLRQRLTPLDEHIINRKKRGYGFFESPGEVLDS